MIPEYQPSQEVIALKREWFRVATTYGYVPRLNYDIGEVYDNLYNAMRDTVYDIERGLCQI